MESAPVLPAGNPESIVAAAQLLRDGGVVVIPTDTVYGLAASVFRPEAVARVFQVKERAPDVRVPVLVATAADIPLLAREVPRDAWNLIVPFWPGALTLVLPARRDLPPELTRGGDTIAVRVPAALPTLRLLEVLGEPIVGTSANISGWPAARTWEAAAAQIGGRVDAILADDNAVTGGLPSTVVELQEGQPIIHRVGAISSEQIRNALGARRKVREDLTYRSRPR
ncbi:MAG TPA: L-threonylcarbamoyladenylate synthase [Chloroflexota bacterium]|nr:L-threonylcarbamoyladenylate synthase [Chloroflexota bacterium]